MTCKPSYIIFMITGCLDLLYKSEWSHVLYMYLHLPKLCCSVYFATGSFTITAKGKTTLTFDFVLIFTLNCSLFKARLAYGAGFGVKVYAFRTGGREKRTRTHIISEGLDGSSEEWVNTDLLAKAAISK